MKSDVRKGLLYGLIAGIIDLTPMLIMGLTWDANLSALSMWIVVGLLISATNLKIKGVLKGLLISFLILIPNAFLIGWNNPVGLIPIAIMTLLLGSGLGYFL